jgi:hypothetical protein
MICERARGFDLAVTQLGNQGEELRTSAFAANVGTGLLD